MGITSSNKVVDRSEVGCDGEFQVTLALTAAPDIIENPTDLGWCWTAPAACQACRWPP